ncbi:homoserine dehydrogenase-domain-containing protein [Penicillium cataractarum]|uniref:Homoserine dehydrogenase n=1 Tax=Penicillium cataractarum TaxID=2100454 RepID=A0A9W9S023_9EURO|nr:homoserine dehydrogenase-domain-containing protein [Penicillium cataractarum]KAJ5369242.1 homoserine dehydrogenase-domain-containing protein [Penicillium cataractarum]
MTHPKQIHIAVIGAGGVGSCFLSQLAWLAKNQQSARLSLCYLATIDGALYNRDYADIDIETALPTLEAKGSALPSISDTIEYLAGAPHKVVLVDNTSSGAIAEAYPEFLKRGISIITPNKKAFSESFKLWRDIFRAAELGSSMVYHESSVGAGMPIISTLKELVQTGDEVTRIEGVFSGTMSFLFNQFSPKSGQAGKWSETVKKAKELGYTEPDPRDDLNGLDVARKLTIMGRLAGLPIESPTSFPVQNLIPGELQSCDTSEEFMSRLHEFDDHMEGQKLLAERSGKVLRYVGSIEMSTGNVKVGMEMFDHMHPIATLKGSDNIISFYTKRYGELPLTIRGAGAGGDVTAMGVTADLLKVLSQMG